MVLIAIVYHLFFFCYVFIFTPRPSLCSTRRVEQLVQDNKLMLLCIRTKARIFAMRRGSIDDQLEEGSFVSCLKHIH
ncbi:hypothetical protein V8C43DRAFT_298746 [Trichoderma afarasin]